MRNVLSPAGGIFNSPNVVHSILFIHILVGRLLCIALITVDSWTQCASAPAAQAFLLVALVALTASAALLTTLATVASRGGVLQPESRALAQSLLGLRVLEKLIVNLATALSTNKPTFLITSIDNSAISLL